MASRNNKAPNPIDTLKEYDLLDWFWPMRHMEDEPLTLKFSDGTSITFQKGERIIFPKQLEFMEAMYVYDAVLFGGAKAGGKSRTMIRLVALYLIQLAKMGHVKANGAIFSETFKAAWDRHAAEIIKGLHFKPWMGEFNQQHMVFRACEELGGWTIEFRNTTDYEEAEKSTQYAIVGIDESTNQPEGFFDHIGTCMRWTTNGVPVEHCPMLLATNPIGMGIAWHKRRFIEAGADKPFYDDIHKIQRMGHHFIQSLPTDNPSNSKQMLSRLRDKPPKVRDALYFGLWDVFEGQFFDIDEHVHLMKPFTPPPTWTYTLSLDWGFRHTGCALVSATDPMDGTTYFIDCVSVVRTMAHDMKELMRKQFVFKNGPNEGKPYPFRFQVADPDLFKRDGIADLSKTVIGIMNTPDKDANGNIVFGGYRFTPAARSRKAGWQALNEGLHYDYEEVTDPKTGRLVRNPHSSPQIRIFRGLTELWSSLQMVQHKDKDPDDAQESVGEYEPGEGDDEARTAAYNVLACRKGQFGGTEDIYAVDRSIADHLLGNRAPGQFDRIEQSTVQSSGYNPFGKASVWAQ